MKAYHYEPCGDCDKGFIPVGSLYRLCTCNNGLRIHFVEVSDALIRAVTGEGK